MHTHAYSMYHLKINIWIELNWDEHVPVLWDKCLIKRPPKTSIRYHTKSVLLPPPLVQRLEQWTTDWRMGFDHHHSPVILWIRGFWPAPTQSWKCYGLNGKAGIAHNQVCSLWMHLLSVGYSIYQWSHQRVQTKRNIWSSIIQVGGLVLSKQSSPVRTLRSYRN